MNDGFSLQTDIVHRCFVVLSSATGTQLLLLQLLLILWHHVGWYTNWGSRFFTLQEVHCAPSSTHTAQLIFDTSPTQTFQFVKEYCDT